MTTAQIGGLCIDGICLLLMVIALIAGFRKGFAAMLVHFLAWLVSLVGGIAVASVGAPFLYDKLARPALEAKLAEGLAASSVGPEAMAKSLIARYQELPGLLRQGVRAVSGNVEGTLTELAQNSQDSIPKLVCEKLLAPVATFFFSILIFLVVSMVLGCLLHALARRLEGHWDIPVLGGVNSFLGGVLGLVHGGLLILVFVLIVSLVFVLSGGSWQYLSTYSIQKSFCMRTLCDWLSLPGKI